MSMWRSGTDNQVLVFSAEGKRLRDIGRPGGRTPLGPWMPDGMAHAAGIAVDAEEKLWVAEADPSPKRFSVWETGNGKLLNEFLGPPAYGALGGSINPLEPRVMVGQGCEWLLDATTGQATCLGVITREEMNNSRFGLGANRKLYLAVASELGAQHWPDQDLRTDRGLELDLGRLQAADHDRPSE